jgi:hypothetical protein
VVQSHWSAPRWASSRVPRHPNGRLDRTPVPVCRFRGAVISHWPNYPSRRRAKSRCASGEARPTPLPLCLCRARRSDDRNDPPWLRLGLALRDSFSVGSAGLLSGVTTRPIARASSAHLRHTLMSMTSVRTRYSATSPHNDRHRSHFITSLRSPASLDAIPKNSLHGQALAAGKAQKNTNPTPIIAAMGCAFDFHGKSPLFDTLLFIRALLTRVRSPFAQ